MEPLAERPGFPDDDTGRALLARDGDGVTAFVQDGYDGITYARERKPDGTWSPEQEVPCVSPDVSPRYCEVHAAAVGAAGELVALVQLNAGRRTALGVSVRLADQTTWSDPKIISSTYRIAGAFKPTIGRSARGGLLATFTDYHRDQSTGLVAVYLEPGQRWGAATYDLLPVVVSPKVSGVSRVGGAVAVFASESGLSAPVLAARFTPGRGWTRPTRIGTGWTENYAVAVDLDGRAVVTWLETTQGIVPSSIGAQSQRVRVSTPHGGWSPARVLARGERGTSGNAVAWIRGEVGVAWGPGTGEVRVAVKRAGRQWQTSTVAGGARAGAVRSVDLNEAGDLVLTWENARQGVGYSLAVALRPRGGSWSAPQLVYTDLQSWAIGAALAQDGGSALVAYGDDVMRQVVARRLFLDPAQTSE